MNYKKQFEDLLFTKLEVTNVASIDFLQQRCVLFSSVTEELADLLKFSEFAVYGHDFCQSCKKLKEILQNLNLDWAMKDVLDEEKGSDYLQDLIELQTIPDVELKSVTIPYMVFGDKHDDDFQKLFIGFLKHLQYIDRQDFWPENDQYLAWQDYDKCHIYRFLGPEIENYLK